MSAFHQDGKELDIVISAATTPGILIQYAGTVCIVNPNPNTADDGSADWQAGDIGSVRRNCVVRIPNTDGISLSDGDDVNYDQTNDKATAIAADFVAGKAVGAHTAADAYIKTLI